MQICACGLDLPLDKKCVENQDWAVPGRCAAGLLLAKLQYILPFSHSFHLFQERKYQVRLRAISWIWDWTIFFFHWCLASYVAKENKVFAHTYARSIFKKFCINDSINYYFNKLISNAETSLESGWDGGINRKENPIVDHQSKCSKRPSCRLKFTISAPSPTFCGQVMR